MPSSKNQSGPFESILTIAGLITGGMLGFENGEIGGAIMGALVLGIIGNRVGALADFIWQLLLFIALILLNTAVRQFIWGVVQGNLNGAG